MGGKNGIVLPTLVHFPIEIVDLPIKKCDFPGNR